MQFETTLTANLIESGASWLANWGNIPQPPPKRYDMPPRGAAGEAVIVLMWTAEFALYAGNLRAKLEAGQITAEQLAAALATGPAWKEIGGEDAVKNAAQLPDKYKGVLSYLLYCRGLVRAAYRGSRPATATAYWVRDRTPVDGGAVGELLTDAGVNPASSPVMAAAWVWPVVVLGIAGMAAGAWYGSKKAEAGVAIEAEKAFAMAQAWSHVKIALIQAAAGQQVTVPDFVSRGAQMEAAQSSPWLIGGVAAAAGVGAGAALFYGLSRPARRNPSRGKLGRAGGKDYLVKRYRDGSFHAWRMVDGKRGRTLDVSGASTYAQARAAAGAQLRALNPAAPKKTNPKRKTTKRKAAKRKAAKRKTAKRKTTKRNPNKTKRKTTKRNPNKTKRKATKRKTTKRNPNKTARDKFIASQKRKGRSEKQAAATWKAMRAMRVARKKKGSRKKKR